LVAETGLVVLTASPAVLLVTLTVIVQAAPPAISAPVSDSEVLPAAAAGVIRPLQVEVKFGGFAIDMPAGKVSVTDTEVRVVAGFGLVMVIVICETPPEAICAGVKDFVIDGGTKATTFRVAVAVLPVVAPAVVEVTLFVVLTAFPSVVLVTTAVMVQLEFAAMVAPLRLIAVPPTARAGVNVPPQVFVVVSGVAMETPAGKASLKATPFNAMLPFGLVTVIVSVEVPPDGIVAGVNAFVMLGAAVVVTSSVALAVPPVPALVETTADVVLVTNPSVALVTFTVTVQLPPAATVPPLRLIAVPPTTGVGVSVPPQVLLTINGVAMETPPGKVSVKPTPVSATPAFGLVTVMARADVPPEAIFAGVNDFTIVGGCKTASVAEALLPVPPSVDVTACVVFTALPMVVLVMSAVIVQLPPAAMVPPLSVNEVLPTAGAGLSVPPHVLLTFNGVAMLRPAGNGSVIPTPVSAVPAFGLVMVMVSVEVPPDAMPVGAKVLVTFGATVVLTLSVAVAVLPAPPLVEVTLPVVLTALPSVVLVTATVIVQVPFAATVPPLRLTAVPPAASAGLNVPPQVLVVVNGAAMVRPAGKASLKVTPVSAAPVFGLVMVMASVEVPPDAMFAGVKDLAIFAGARPAVTFRVAVAVLPAPPSVEVMLPVVFTALPTVVLVTFT